MSLATIIWLSIFGYLVIGFGYAAYRLPTDWDREHKSRSGQLERAIKVRSEYEIEAVQEKIFKEVRASAQLNMVGWLPLLVAKSVFSFLHAADNRIDHAIKKRDPQPVENVIEDIRKELAEQDLDRQLKAIEKRSKQNQYKDHPELKYSKDGQWQSGGIVNPYVVMDDDRDY